MKGKTIAIVVIAVAVMGSAAFVSVRRAENKGTSVRTEEIKRGDLVQIVSGTGRVRPVTEVSISANVAGRIVALDVRPGDDVIAGQELVRLDQTRYLAALAQAKAMLASARTQVDLAAANLRQAEAEHGRKAALSARGLVSTADLESALAARDVRAASLRAAHNDVERAGAALDQARDDLSKTTILAPMNATVTEVRREKGEMALGAEFQEDVIMVLADLSSMEVRFEIDENDIVNVAGLDSVGVEVEAFPDTTFPGRVREIATTALNRGIGTQEAATVFEVKADLLGDAHEVRPGMSATVDVYSDRRDDVLRVPIQAVTARSEATLAGWDDAENEEEADDAELIEIAFVVNDGEAQYRRVKTGISGDNHLEVLAGLEEGDEVVTGPYRTLSRELKHGERVKAEEEKEDGDE